jgi:hypothetical protein
VWNFDIYRYALHRILAPVFTLFWNCLVVNHSFQFSSRLCITVRFQKLAYLIYICTHKRTQSVVSQHHHHNYLNTWKSSGLLKSVGAPVLEMPRAVSHFKWFVYWTSESNQWRYSLCHNGTFTRPTDYNERLFSNRLKIFRRYAIHLRSLWKKKKNSKLEELTGISVAVGFKDSCRNNPL